MVAKQRPHLGGDHSEGGFTLIELMITLLIIGILVGIALPTFLGARERSEDRATQADLRTGLAAALVYFSDGETFTGFDVADGIANEPTLAWIAPGPPGHGEVAIQVASGSSLLLVGYSRSDTYFCLAQLGTPGATRGGDATFDNVDTVAECTGGW